MKAIATTPVRKLISEFTPRESGLVSVAVVYDDVTMRTMAADIQRHICERLPDFEFKFSWWKIDLLLFLTFAEAGAINAAKADIILFAIHARTDLPLIKAWMEKWLPHHARNDGALAALIEAKDEQGMLHSPIFCYLKHTSRRAGLDFISDWTTGRPKRCDCKTTCTDLSHRATVITPLLKKILSGADAVAASHRILPAETELRL